MDFWKVLGIEPTTDKNVIQEAYYNLLNQYHPEEDPEGFQMLRDAYQQAMAYDETDEEEDSDIGRFMGKVEELYHDYERRINPDCWSELLQDDICIQIDMVDEISHRLLRFFMDNYYMPHEVWKVINDFFGWNAKKEELSEKFPRNFLDFMESYSERELYIRYDAFDFTEPVDYDEFIRTYNRACYEVNNRNIYDAMQAVRDASAIYDKHPDLRILNIRCEEMLGHLDKVIEMCDEMLKENSKEKDAILLKAGALRNKGKVQEAFECYKQSYEIKPEIAEDIYNMGLMTMKFGDVSEARDLLYRLKDDRNYSLRAWNLVQDINEILKDRELEDIYEQLKENPLDAGLNQKLIDCWYRVGEYQKCADILTDLEEKTELNDELCISMGNALTELDKIRDAVEYYRKAIAVNPDNGTACGLLAGALHDLKKYDEALEMYDKAIAKSDEKSVLLNNKANMLVMMERYQEAIQCCNESLEIESNFPYAFNNRAAALCQMGEYEDALADCDRAISIYPYFSGPYKNKAKVYNKTGRHYEALQVCEEAFRMEQYEATIYYQKAEAMYYLNKKEEAMQLCRTAIDKDKDYDEPYYLIGEIYYHSKNYKKALTYYNKAVQHNSKKGYYYVCIADVNKEMGNIDKAIAAYSTAIRLIPRYNYARIERAKLYKRQKRYEKAIEDMKAILEYDENNAYCYVELGDIYEQYNMSKESNEDSLKYYDRAIDIDPEYAYAYVSRASYHADRDKYDESIPDYDKAIEIDPEYLYAINSRGIAYMRMGQYDRAIKDFERSIEIDDKFFYGYNNIGECYCHKGNKKEGIKYFTQAVDLNPDYIYGFMNRGLARFDVEDYKGALEDLTTVVNSNAMDYRSINTARKYRARALVKLGRTDEAIADYEDILKLDIEDKEVQEELNKLRRKTDKGKQSGGVGEKLKGLFKKKK